MKYKLETIPVWDAFREDCECPFCLMQEKAEIRYLKYYLGNSAMNPETRVELNRSGFCPEHFSKLLTQRNPQHLGLITHTHLQDWMKDREKHFPQTAGHALTEKTEKKSLFSRKRSPAQAYRDHCEDRSRDCLICDRIDRTIKRYTFTACYLWKRNEEGFKEFLKEGKGFCIPHESSLLLMAEEILKGNDQKQFFTDIRELQRINFKRLEEELNWFTQKFKAENSSKPWGNSEDAHYRAIQKLSGRKTAH